jgi:hypothetical protein
VDDILGRVVTIALSGLGGVERGEPVPLGVIEKPGEKARCFCFEP